MNILSLLMINRGGTILTGHLNVQILSETGGEHIHQQIYKHASNVAEISL